MAKDGNLVPPLAEINARLSENQRERGILRQLQRMAFRQASRAQNEVDLKPRLTGDRHEQVDGRGGS